MKFAKPILIALVLALVTLGVLYTQKAPKPQTVPETVATQVVAPAVTIPAMAKEERPSDGPLLTPTEAEQLRADSVKKALGSKISLSDLFDTTKVTGAAIDESTVTEVVRVDPSDPNAAPTLGEGLRRAWAKLAEGTPCKLLIASGTYREVAPADLDWTNPTVRATTFIIEGQGAVEWSGADLYAPSAWKDEGEGFYSHPWAYTFGNNESGWSLGKRVVGHRSEMVFVRGLPLKQRLSETYTCEFPGPKAPKTLPTHTYTGFREPKSLLQPGEFSVSEREENDRRLWIRLRTGETMPSDGVEVSVRPELIQFRGKQNLVLRGIDFVKAATSKNNYWNAAPLSFARKPEDDPANIRIERCRFLWNNLHGLHFVKVRNLSLTNVEASNNGGNGINAWEMANSLWASTTTNFNLWRSRWAGDIGYSTGGVKVHRVNGHVVLGHTSIGNQDVGFWYDIDCKDVYMQDITLVGGPIGLFWELSHGPFHARRVLASSGYGRSLFFFNVGEARLEDSIITTSHNGSAYPLMVYGGSNRDDAHAREIQGKSLESFVELNHTLFSLRPEQPCGLIQYLDQRDPNRPDYAPYTFKGRNGVYWSPGNAKPFEWNARQAEATTDGTNRDSQRVEGWDTDTWLAKQESDSQVVDPLLAAPESFDYRLRNDSPMAKEGTRYPQVVLSDEIKETMRTYETQKWFEPPQ